MRNALLWSPLSPALQLSTCYPNSSNSRIFWPQVKPAYCLDNCSSPSPVGSDRLAGVC